MTIPFEEIKKRLLANPAVKAEYDRLAPEFAPAFGPGCHKRNLQRVWKQVSPQLHGWKADSRCRARRLCCVLPKRLGQKLKSS
jgi:hypothetical protein